MGETEEQINEMLKVYEINENVDDPIKASEEDASDQIQTEELSKDETPTEEVLTEPPAPPEETELEKLRREQVEMRQKMDEIISRSTTPPPQSTEPSTPQPIEEQDFIGDADLEDTLNNPKELNKLLNKVFQKGIEAAEQRNSDLRTSLPETIRNNVITLESLRKASDRFYEENKDLVPFKGAVATVFGELSSQHPDWKYEQLLKESEVETRNRLNLPKQTESTPKDVPRLPHKTGQRRSTPEPKSTNPLLNEIDAMNAVLT